jgi:hypothetical protein
MQLDFAQVIYITKINTLELNINDNKNLFHPSILSNISSPPCNFNSPINNIIPELDEDDDDDIIIDNNNNNNNTTINNKLQNGINMLNTIKSNTFPFSLNQNKHNYQKLKEHFDSYITHSPNEHNDNNENINGTSQLPSRSSSATLTDPPNKRIRLFCSIT